MSVAIPKASVVFGSVTPPQDDIVDLHVHLGCSTEISSFECTLQNWDKKYSPDGGTYPIVEGSVATISGGREPNCPLLLTGIVEETDPESRAVEHYIIIRGRCNGEQLFRRHVNKSWDNVKGETVVKYLIDNYTSLSHSRGGTELIEDTDTTYTSLEYEDTPVFDIIKYIAETADKAGAIGYDFRIAPDGKFEFFPKNSKTSSVDLSERLEVGRHKRSIAHIKNKIPICGAPERPEPLDKDEWTEPTQDPPENWVAVSSDTTISRQTAPSKIGTYHVQASRLAYGTLDFYRSISSIKVAKNTCLKFWYYHNFPVDSIKVRLRAPDATNYFEATITDLGEIEWHPVEVTTGKGSEYNPDSNPNGVWTKVGAASWSDIQAIEFVVTRTGGVVVFHVDGIFFDKNRWKYTAEDSASQTQYSLRERQPEVDEELHSDAECEYRAKALLDFLKGPSITPTVRSTVIDYGTTPILAGDKGHIVLPNESVDADYPLIAVDYRCNMTEATLEIELQLEKEQILLADFIYGFRKSIMKLDKYKASVTGGVVATGGGGGGMVQHGNELHTPDFEEYGKIKGKPVDDSAIGDDKILVYKQAPDALVYEAKPSGGSGTPESILMGCIFMSLSGLDVYSTGGTVTKYSWGCKVESAASSPYKGYAHYQLSDVDAIALFDKNPQFEFYIRYSHIVDLYEKWVIIGGTAGIIGTAAHKKFGICITAANELKIVSSDGTTQSYSAALMTLAQNTWYRIRCKLSSGSQIEVWVDGVSKGTKNTNLPSGVLTAAHACPQIYCVSANLDGATVRYAGLKVMHDY